MESANVLSKQQIIELVAANTHYNSICKKIAKDLSEDLYQEFFVVLCEYAPEKIEGIYARGELKYFCVSLLYQMFHFKRTPFHRKFRKDVHFVELESKKFVYDEEFADMVYVDDILFISDQGYDFDTDTLLERIDDKLKSDLSSSESSEWYNAKIFSLYMQEGSSRKLAKKINIPYRSIAHTVKQYKEKLRLLKDGKAA